MTNTTPLSITTPGLVITGDTHTSTTIDGITSTAMLVAGMRISGPGIPAGTYITRIKDGVSILISAAATATTAGVKLACFLEDTTPVTEIGFLTTGIIGQPLVPQHTPAAANFTAMTAQTIYGCGWMLRRGQIVTGIGLSMSTKAVGTPPTTTKFGLLDKLGKVLVLTANVASDAQWTASANVPLSFPLTAAYTIPYDGLYRVAGLTSAVWTGGGAVQPLCSRQSLNTPSSSAAVVSGGEPTYVTQTGQTDFAAVGSSQTLAADAVGLQIIMWPLG